MPSVPPKPRRIQWWFRLTSEGRGTRVVYECEVDFGPAANIFVRAETDADSLLSNGSRARREGLATADTATGVMSTYAVRCIGLRPVADLASCGGELRRLGWSPPTDVSAHPILVRSARRPWSHRRRRSRARLIPAASPARVRWPKLRLDPRRA